MASTAKQKEKNALAQEIPQTSTKNMAKPSKVMQGDKSSEDEDNEDNEDNGDESDNKDDKDECDSEGEGGRNGEGNNSDEDFGVEQDDAAGNEMVCHS